MSATSNKETIKYSEYKSELQLPEIIHLIENDLSEPYSVYTYRYFIHNWPNLCFLVSFNCSFSQKISYSSLILQAKDGDKYVGVIICKLDRHKDRLRGYIAMLAVAKTHRKMSIGSNLVKMAIHAMKDMNADEVRLQHNNAENG